MNRRSFLAALVAVLTAVWHLISAAAVLPSLFLGLILNGIVRLVIAGPAGYAIAVAILLFMPPLPLVLVTAIAGFDASIVASAYIFGCCVWGVWLAVKTRRSA